MSPYDPTFDLKINVSHGPGILPYILTGVYSKDFKNAQFLTDCISGTTACRDKMFISETRNDFFVEIRCPDGRKNVAVEVLLTLMVLMKT